MEQESVMQLRPQDGVAAQTMFTHTANPETLDQTPHHDRSGAIADTKMESDDNDDDDEGVSLINNQSSVQTHVTASIDDLNRDARYLQISPTNPADISTVWQLPVTPLNFRLSVLKKQYGVTKPMAVSYHRNCHLISRHWHCQPGDIIPPSLRESTPYSLALLITLRHVASHTKLDLPKAQSMLLQSWQERIGRLKARVEGAPTFFASSTAERVYAPCESTIIEHTLGLTLDDAVGALKSSRKGGFANKQKLAAEPSGEANVKTTSRLARRKAIRAEKRERFRREAIAGLAGEPRRPRRNRSGDQLVDIEIGSRTDDGTVPPNSPDLLTQVVGSMEPARPGLPNDGVQPQQQTDQQKQGFRYNSKQDRYEDSLMSRMLDHVEIDNYERRKARTVKLMQRGASRKPSQPNSMPLEKMDFNSLPTLQTEYPRTDKVALEKLGQLSLDATLD